jgi:hypothetical protein
MAAGIDEKEDTRSIRACWRDETVAVCQPQDKTPTDRGRKLWSALLTKPHGDHHQTSCKEMPIMQ